MRLLGYGETKDRRVGREMAGKTVKRRGCDTVTTVERWLATGKCNTLAADELIAILLDDRQDWIYRAWSAMLLASRDEKAVTEALFHATQRDPVYWVRRERCDRLGSLSETWRTKPARHSSGIRPGIRLARRRFSKPSPDSRFRGWDKFISNRWEHYLRFVTILFLSNGLI